MSHGFMVGLAIGALVPVVSAMWARRWARPLALGGLLVSAALLAAIDIVKQVPDRVTFGVIVLAVVGFLPHKFLPLAAGGLVFGAWLIAFETGITSGAGAPRVAALAIVVGGPLVASFDRKYGATAITLPLLAITGLGIVITVPTTEVAIIAAGVLLTASIAGSPLRLARLGSSGAPAVVAILVWVIAGGGQARPGAIVGGVASLGLLAAEPAIRAMLHSETTLVGRLLAAGPTGRAAVVLGHGALVLFTSRVAGLQQEMAGATLYAVPVFLLAGLIAVARPEATPKPQ